MGVGVGTHDCYRAYPVESDQELRKQARARVFTCSLNTFPKDSEMFQVEVQEDQGC